MSAIIVDSKSNRALERAHHGELWGSGSGRLNEFINLMAELNVLDVMSIHSVHLFFQQATEYLSSESLNSVSRPESQSCHYT